MTTSDVIASPELRVSGTTKVEVLVVSYNTVELTRRCLGSVLDARVPEGVELGIAVLDNGSKDGTAEMILREFPQVRFRREPVNLFYGPACNWLVRSSGADYLLLLNADAEAPPELLEVMLAPMAEDPSVVLTYPAIAYPDGAVVQPHDRFPSIGHEVASQLRGTRLASALRPLWDAESVVARHRRPLPDDRTGADVAFVHSTCWLMRRSDALRLGPFDDRFPMYDVDLDMCRRLDATGRRALLVPATIGHVGGASSPSPAKQRMMREGRAQYYRVHHSVLHMFAFRALQIVPVIKRRRQRTRKTSAAKRVPQAW